MENIYLPIEVDDSMCIYFLNNTTLRVLEDIPEEDLTINYTDYFMNNHYYFREGQIIYDSSTLPNCMDPDLFTNDYFYRNDFPQIIIIWFFVGIFVYYIPLKIWRRLFRRFN